MALAPPPSLFRSVLVVCCVLALSLWVSWFVSIFLAVYAAAVVNNSLFYDIAWLTNEAMVVGVNFGRHVVTSV